MEFSFGVNDLDYIVIDLETTGIDAQKAKIIEVGAVKIKDGKAAEEWQSFVNPHCVLPKEIKALTGITDKMVKHAPDFTEILPRLRDFVNGYVLVAHNAAFEKSFLGYSLPEARWLDSIELSKIAWPKEKSYSLAALTKAKGITDVQAHRALGDAQITAQLLQKAAAAIADFPPEALHNLYLLTIKKEEPLLALVQEIVARELIKFAPLPEKGSPLFAAFAEKEVLLTIAEKEKKKKTAMRSSL